LRPGASLADAVHGMQPARRLQVRARRLAQPGHDAIPYTRCDVAPVASEDGVAGERPGGRGDRQRQQRECLGFERPLAAAAPEAPAGEIDHHVVAGRAGPCTWKAAT